MLWRIGLVMLVVGGVFAFMGGKDLILSEISSAAPEEISLKSLIQRGPEGNPNIILKDFTLQQGDVIYETKNRLSSWTKAWVPIVPTGANPMGKGNIQAILISTRSKDMAELNSRCQVPRLQGMLLNKVESLGREERKLLQESYPGTNLDSCLLFHEGKTPSSGTFLAVMLGLAAVLILGGAGILVFGFLQMRQESSTPVKKKKKKKRPVEEEDELEEVDEIEEVEEERPRKKKRIVEDDEDDAPRPKKRRRYEDD